MNLLMEREEDLNDLEERGNRLSSSALNFEQTGIALKNKIFREKLKMLAVMSGVILLTLGGIYLIFKWIKF